MPTSFDIHEFPPTRSNRALWAFGEAGINPNRHRVDLPGGAHRSPSFQSINPLGYVPVMTIDGTSVIESAAIALFVAESAPEKGLIPPPGSVARALAYQWAVFAPAELDHRIAVVTQNTMLLPPEKRDPAAAQSARKGLEPRLTHVADALGGSDWLLDQFSIADIVVGHSIAWAVMADLLRDHPALRSYLDRLLTRPAFREVYGEKLEPMPDPHAVETVA